MLTTELLIHRFAGESLRPLRLPLDEPSRAMAMDAIVLFLSLQGQSQGAVDEALRALEGEGTDYRVRRGLAHLLAKQFSSFEIVSPLEPAALRERLFMLAASAAPSVEHSAATLQRAAAALSMELGQEVTVEGLRQALYADLAKNRVLVRFEEPTPEQLIHRYNLAQVQGIFYRATELTIHAYRNDPGEYKLLFRYLKLFQLLATIEGDPETGFTLRLDGPASLFHQTTRYGNKLAMMIPALLHVTKWRLEATLQRRTREGTTLPGRYTLDSECGLVSHYPPSPPYDSMLEESLAGRWPKSSQWCLEREVELVPVPGSVMIPDFRLVHPDGRSFLLEIVGYWRPEYLRKKLWQVQQAGRDDVILAISERLNLEKAGVEFRNSPARLLWFKDKISPRQVLDLIEG